MAGVGGDRVLGPAAARELDAIVCTYQSCHKLPRVMYRLLIVDEAHHVYEEIYGSPPPPPASQAPRTPPEVLSAGPSSEDAFVHSCSAHFVSTRGEQPGLGSIQEDRRVSGMRKQRDPPARRHYADAISKVRRRAALLVSATLPLSRHEKPDYAFGLEQAIGTGLLCDYHIVVPAFAVVQEGQTKQPLSAKVAGLVAEHPEWSHILAYCNSLGAAEEFCGLLNGAGVPATWFSGATPVSQRRATVQAFEEGRYRALVSVRTLGEGVDIPCASVALFVEPRASHIDVAQCAGRVLRRSPGKTTATVVLPSLDEEQDLRSFVRALQAADPRLRQPGTLRGRLSILGRAADVAAEDRAGSARLEQLSEAAYDRFGAILEGEDRWARTLGLLRRFVAERGRLPSQAGGGTDTYGGIQLAPWCQAQRHLKKTGRLAPERQRQLEGVPGWHWLRADRWSAVFSCLQEYMTASSCTRLPQVGTTVQLNGRSVDLAGWCARQRQEYKAKSLPADKQIRLESIQGWWWETKSRYPPWEETLALLKEFVAARGRWPMSHESHPSPIGASMPLGRWCANQLASRRRGTLSASRWAQLDAIPTSQ